MSQAPQDEEQPEIVFPAKFGRYTLLRRVGEGGMGEIFLASLQGGGIAGVEKICVIKKLRRMYTHDEEFVGRFLDEARLMVQLNHANIVPVFDAGNLDGDYFLAMELVDGIDLKELCAFAARSPGGTLEPAVALYVTREILGALGYAHRKKDAQGRPLGVVHRDVSPQNVLISVDGEVKLIDFGLAKSSQKALKTDPRVVLGKYAYMSPEQARGQPVDGRSDLFAVGLLLFELIAGRKLWDGVTVGELMEQIANHKVFPPGKVKKGVDPEIDALVEHALLKDTAARFQTAEEFREAVSRVLSRVAPTLSPDDVGRAVRRARGESVAEPPKQRIPINHAEATEALDLEPPAPSTRSSSDQTSVVRPRKSDPPASVSNATPVTVETEEEAPHKEMATWKLVAVGVALGTVVVLGMTLAWRATQDSPAPPAKAATPPKEAPPEEAPPASGQPSDVEPEAPAADPKKPAAGETKKPAAAAQKKPAPKPKKPAPKPQKKTKGKK